MLKLYISSHESLHDSHHENHEYCWLSFFDLLKVLGKKKSHVALKKRWFTMVERKKIHLNKSKVGSKKIPKHFFILPPPKKKHPSQEEGTVTTPTIKVFRILPGMWELLLLLRYIPKKSAKSTLWKFNIAPQKKLSQKENLPTLIFSGASC